MVKMMDFAVGLKNDVTLHSENNLCSERSGNSGPPSPSGSSETGSSRGKRKVHKLCAVCGDKALGFNFDAVTCESCKAFFRRNAMKDEIPKCIFDQQCKVDVNTRRFCTYCRLQKCFKVGMKKDMILDDNQKRQRMEKVRQNRQRRQGSGKTPSGDENGLAGPVLAPATALLPSASSRPAGTAVVAAIIANTPSSASSASSVGSSVSPVSTGAALAPDDSGLGAGLLLSPLDCLSSAPEPKPSPCLASEPAPVIKGEANNAWESAVGRAGPLAPAGVPTSGTGPAGDYYDAAINAISAAVFSGGELPPSGQPHLVSLNQELSRKAMARLLSQEEWNAVSDLHEAYKSSFLETSDQMPERKCSLINLVNTSGFIVRKLINFAKKLSDFTNLPQACQIALLKGVVLNTLFVRSATHFDPDRNVWITPRGQVPASILAEATGHRDLYEEHGKFCRQFLAVIDNDENLVPLIQVLSLFSPDRPALGDEHQRVSDIQDRYICLVKHYLEARHGYCVSRHRFQEVLSCLGALQTLTDNHGKVLLHVNPNEVDPLMLEVFDLKTTLLHEAEAAAAAAAAVVDAGRLSHGDVFAKLA